MSGKSLEMTTGCCLTSVHSWLPFGGVARTIAPQIICIIVVLKVLKRIKVLKLTV